MMDGPGAAFGRLLAEIRRHDRVVVAFSGGVDSTLLLDACLQALGPDRVLAATLAAPYVPRAEIHEARRLAADLGARHEVVDLPRPEALRDRPQVRCYVCKRHLLGRLQALGGVRGFTRIVEGSNADDLGDHRPGMRAVRELGVRSPLLQAGLDKAAVRQLSRRRGLDTWDKPAQACLMTRFPHGTDVTMARLRRLEAAEAVLHDLGFSDVRVREHGDLARIEVPAGRIPDLVRIGLERGLEAALRGLGYARGTVDLAGYRKGSFNSSGARRDTAETGERS